MQSNHRQSAQIDGATKSLEKLFTPLDLERAGIASRSKLKKDRIKGVGIPFLYVGRRVRYKASAVDSYIKANSATRALQLPADDPRKSAMSASARAKRSQ